MYYLILLALLSTSYAFGNIDTIWYNADILTMSEHMPRAEAIAISGGRIVEVGKNDNILRMKEHSTKIIDLRGKTLLPGFIDAHGHLSGVALQAVSANMLPPPDGKNSSIKDLEKTLREFEKTSNYPTEFGILIGFGYDDSQLVENRHPTRDDLDKVSKKIPILLIHQSGHMGAMNSKALTLVGITSKSPNPKGGIIRRKENSKEPNGVLEENAFFENVTKIFPKLSEEKLVDILLEGEKTYVENGYTTIQDGRSAPAQVETLIRASKEKKLRADVVSYLDILIPKSEEYFKPPYFYDSDAGPMYTNHFRIGGYKLTLDGSPQAKTAWLSKPYYKAPPGESKDYAGYGVVSDKVADESYGKALEHHRQILTHANGDRAIDQLISSYGKMKKKFPATDIRPVLIHGQTLRKDQVAKIKELGIFPSLYPLHTFYWGDWHRKSVLGPDRAQNISPTGWLREEKMSFTIHHDAPVVPPDSIAVISSAVTRKTRSGEILGENQKITPYVALKAMTDWAAYQYFEDKTKGTLEKGKIADFVILSNNPVDVKEDKIKDIKVLETIKEGNTIFRRSTFKPVQFQAQEEEPPKKKSKP